MATARFCDALSLYRRAAVRAVGEQSCRGRQSALSLGPSLGLRGNQSSKSWYRDSPPLDATIQRLVVRLIQLKVRAILSLTLLHNDADYPFLRLVWCSDPEDNSL